MIGRLSASLLVPRHTFLSPRIFVLWEHEELLSTYRVLYPQEEQLGLIEADARLAFCVKVALLAAPIPPSLDSMSFAKPTLEAASREEASPGVLTAEQIEQLLQEAETRLRNASDAAHQDLEASERQDVIAIETVVKRKPYEPSPATILSSLTS
jgi:hypothetical protein